MGTNHLNMLAVDFGASSGRTILGRWNGVDTFRRGNSSLLE